MAKAQQVKRLVQSKDAVAVEQTVTTESSFLPSADELAKLQQVSTDIVPWIMQRTEVEQNARIKFNLDNMNYAGKDLKLKHIYNYIALFMAFFITIAFLIVSCYLLIKGLYVGGSIFTGATLIALIGIFMRKPTKKE